MPARALPAERPLANALPSGASPPKRPSGGRRLSESGFNWSVLFRNFALNQRSLQVQIRQMIVAAIEERRLAADARMPSSRSSPSRSASPATRWCSPIGSSSMKASSNRVSAAAITLPSSTSATRPLRAGRVARAIGGRPRLAGALRHRAVAAAQHRQELDWLRYPFPFLYGQFDPSLFPTNDWRESARGASSVLEIQNWARDLIDGDDPELIDQLRVHVLPRAGIFAPPEEIIVTVGAQQALFMLAQLFLRKNTTIGIENPGYADARNIFGMMSDRVVPLPVDGDGLIPSKEVAECEYLYVTPAHHCPTTVDHAVAPPPSACSNWPGRTMW